MTQRVNIEIMVDTNANSRKLDGEYDSLREMAASQDAGQERTIREFRNYLREARKAGVEYVVTQRDTAQIFHEKTHLMTPELARQAGHEIYPDFLRENLEQGHYQVEPPIYGEERYYDALEDFLAEILPDKAPQDAKKLESMTPENRGLVLQELFREHMTGLSGKYRNGRYREAFDRYRDVRFNAGEETAVNFLRAQPQPPEGERTAFVFVGSDQWANEQMAKARKGSRREDEGKFEVFVTEPAQFRQLIEQVIRDIEKEQPEMREMRHAKFHELAYIKGDVADMTQGQHAGDAMRGFVAKLDASRPSPLAAARKNPDAKAFSNFVTRLQHAPRENGPQR